jgi:putative proteasome-type protease
MEVIIMRSNISVGPPIDLLCDERDGLKVAIKRRFQKDDPYLMQIQRYWGEGLRRVFANLPGLPG